MSARGRSAFRSQLSHSCTWQTLSHFSSNDEKYKLPITVGEYFALKIILQIVAVIDDTRKQWNLFSPESVLHKPVPSQTQF